MILIKFFKRYAVESSGDTFNVCLVTDDLDQATMTLRTFVGSTVLDKGEVGEVNTWVSFYKDPSDIYIVLSASRGSRFNNAIGKFSIVNYADVRETDQVKSADIYAWKSSPEFDLVVSDNPEHLKIYENDLYIDESYK